MTELDEAMREAGKLEEQRRMNAPGVPETAGEPLTERDILDAHSRRMGLIHDKLFKARELVRARLHPQSEAWERDLFTTLNDALYGVRGSPLVMDMRAGLDARDAAHAARVEAARREGREEFRAAAEAALFTLPKTPPAEALTMAPAQYAAARFVAQVEAFQAIALPTAPTPALDAVVQRAKAEVFEECAKIADGFTCGCCGMDGKVGAAIRSRAPGGKETTA